MNLFEIEGDKLRIQPEAYALIPFKKIWDRDKSKGKVVALEELAYIYYLTDYQSDFVNDPDDSERDKAVRKQCITNSKWEPDKVVKEAIEFYKEMQETIAIKLLDNARAGINKLSLYIRDINFEETTLSVNGEVRPKHDIKKFADTIKQIPDILKALKQLEEAVKLEKEVATNKLRGDRTKSPYEDD